MPNRTKNVKYGTSFDFKQVILFWNSYQRVIYRKKQNHDFYENIKQHNCLFDAQLAIWNKRINYIFKYIRKQLMQIVMICNVYYSELFKYVIIYYRREWLICAISLGLFNSYENIWFLKGGVSLNPTVIGGWAKQTKQIYKKYINIIDILQIDKN